MVKMKALYLGELRTESTHESGAKIQTDAPKDIGGKGEAFSPTDLLAASLATCMLTLMGIEAKKAGFDLKGTTAEIEKEMTHIPSRRVERLIIRIRSPHLPPPLVREKLEKRALECPVHLSLHPDVKKEVDFIWGL